MKTTSVEHTIPQWGRGLKRRTVYIDESRWNWYLSEMDKTNDLITQFVVAAKAAVVHLEACQKGKIQRPFKSASLPLLKAALRKSRTK